MKRIFDRNNPVFRFMDKVCDAALLNFLWILTSIPIVTVGTSTAALQRVTYLLMTEWDGPIAREYFKAMRTNWAGGTKLFFSLFVPAILLTADIWWLTASGQKFVTGALMWGLTILAGGVLFLLLAVAAYALPMQTIFENTTAAYMLNALKLSILYLPRSILVVFFDIAFVSLAIIAVAHIPMLTMFFIFFGAALVTRINLCVVLQTLKPYIKKADA